MKDVLEQIRHLYSVELKSTSYIGKELGIGRYRIEKIIKESDIEYRYKNKGLKADYFENIDTEEKAYWLGYAWCDGNVNVRPLKTGGIDYCFSVDICERDHTHLYKLKDSLGAINKVEKLKTVKASFTSDKWRYRIRIKNRKFCKILIEKYKMIPYRTDISDLVSDIPKKLIKHFIRGVIDADGSIVLDKNDRAHIQVSVSKEMGEFIRNFLQEEGLVKKVAALTPLYIGGLVDLYKIAYGGQREVLGLLNYLYRDANMYMNRKHDKAITIIKKLEESV